MYEVEPTYFMDWLMEVDVPDLIVVDYTITAKMVVRDYIAHDLQNDVEAVELLDVVNSGIYY